jgi:two-component system, LytTR family, response regulator
MKTINYAIIEDEPLGRKTLSALMEGYSTEFKLLQTATTLQQALLLFQNTNIDLFFSDIELADGNVFEALKQVELQRNQYIVFTTAYEEYGAKAFGYPALHYLMKPINPADLAKAIERYKSVTKGNTGKPENDRVAEPEFNIGKLLLPTQNGTVFIDLDEVVRIQSANKFSIVFTSDRKQHIVSRPLTRFEETLEKKGFLRIHDSHLINLKHLAKYIKSGKNAEMVMSDDSKVPVSVRRKDAISAVLKDIL